MRLLLILTFSSFTLVKWDNTGQELWNRTLNGINSWGNAVWANQTNIITVGKTLGFEGYQLTSMQLLLICWDVNGNQLWNITGTYPSLNQGTLVWGNNSNIYIIWYSTGYHLIKFDGVVINFGTKRYLSMSRAFGGMGQIFS